MTVKTVRSSPHEDQGYLTAIKTMEREFLIRSYSMTEGFEFSPLYYLGTQVPVVRVSHMYSYWRWKKLKLRFVLVSLPQQYGFIEILHRFGNSTYNDSMMAALDPYYLTVSSQPTLEMELPWVWPFDWIKTQDTTSLTDNWVIKVFPDFDTIDSTVSSTVQLEIFASFEGVEVACPQIPASVPVGECQMDLPVHVQDVATTSTAAGALAMAATAGGIGNLIEGVSDFIQYVDDAFYDLDGSKAIQQEGVVLSTHGNTAEMSAAGAGCNLDLLPDIGMIDPKYYGDTGRHTIRELIQRPMQIREDTFVAGQQVHQILVPANFLVSGFSRGYLAYFAQFFRRWKGSLKVMIIFTTSSFVTSRFLISMRWAGSIPSVPGDYISEVVTVKGDVVWCREIPYVYPSPWRLTNYNLETTAGPYLDVKLLDIKSTGDRTPSVKTRWFLAAGDDFIFNSYQQPRPPLESEIGESQMDPTSLIRNSQPLPGLAKVRPVTWNLTVEDMMHRWSNRPVYDDSAQPSFERFITFEDITTEGLVGNFDQLNSLFAFNSGSLRYKLSSSSNTGFMEVNFTSVSFYGDFEAYEVDSGQAMTYSDKWNVLDVSIPLVATTNVAMNYGMPVSADLYITRAFMTVGSNTVYKAWVKPGRNFQVFFIQPPPNPEYWPWLG